jgi:maleylpyruvate isomerase
MPVPSADVDATAAAHARLHSRLAGLTDELARRPSLLPDWTVGHVITHVARNADSVVRRLRAAAEGRLVPQYEGGAQGRARDIEAGAGRAAADLLADLHAADDALDALYPRLPDEVWDRTVLTGAGDEVSVPQAVFGRWREVEVHHVDLGLGYAVADWPAQLVARWLPALLERLPERADAEGLVAWLIGRGPAPALGPWG